MIRLIAFLGLIVLAVECRHFQLKTKLGNVTGSETTVNGTTLRRFLGVPYAKPPVGALRFQKPKPAEPFGYLNATQYGKPCIQYFAGNLMGDENCLTLDILVPNSSLGSKKPVVAYIHGGGYEFLWSQFFRGEIFAAFGDVVFVIIQYRLNVFGFLSTGNGDLPGNFGLWDQHEALKWIKNNIDDYGGDSSSITIAGESAGGSAVLYQMLSPHNNISLFQRAITQSLFVPYPDILKRNPLDVTEKIVRAVNCSLGRSLVSCLRGVPAASLIQAYIPYSDKGKIFPVADGEFLAKDLGYNSAIAICRNRHRCKPNKKKVGDFFEYDLLGGWNNQEGLLYMNTLLQANNETTGKDLSAGASDASLRKALRLYPTDGLVNRTNGELILEEIKNFYVNTLPPITSAGRSVDDRRVEAYMRITGDLVFKLALLRWLKNRSVLSRKKTYLFEYIHKPPGVSFTYQGPSWLKTGAGHADELPYIFGLPFLPERDDLTPLDLTAFFRGNNFTDKDRALSATMITSWSNFAKTGNPGPKFYPFFYYGPQVFTVVKADGFTIAKYPMKEELKAWTAAERMINAGKL